MSELIVISPHLDDAVFSCWHSLSYANSVITVFAGKPKRGTSAWWDKLCGEKDSSMMVSKRLKENDKALKYTNAKPINLNFLDAQYRKTNLSAKQIADEIISRTKENDAYIFNLAGSAWCHKDHILTRNAGLELLNKGLQVSFYADIPYMSLPNKTLKIYLNHIKKKAAKITNRQVEISVIRLDKKSHDLKLAAVKEYKSQFKATNLTSFGRLNRYLKRDYEIEIKVIA